jgi:amidase
MMGYAAATEIGAYDMWQIQREQNELCKMYLDRWNACEDLDAILSMAFSLQFYPEILTLRPRSNNSIHYGQAWRLASCGVSLQIILTIGGIARTSRSRYTCIWNILDYTALNFPTGLVADKDLDVTPADQKSFGELDSQVQEKCE